MRLRPIALFCAVFFFAAFASAGASAENRPSLERSDAQALLLREYARTRGQSLLEKLQGSMKEEPPCASQPSAEAARAAALRLELHQVLRKPESAKAAREALGCVQGGMPSADDRGQGLGISALALGAQVLDDEGLLSPALDAGRRLRGSRFAAGKTPRARAATAARCAAFLDLYEASFDPDWLDAAFASGAELLRAAKALRVEGQSGEDAALIVTDLLRLAQFSGRKDLRDAAEGVLRRAEPFLRKDAQAAPGLRIAAQWAQSKPRQIIIAGAAGDPLTQEMLRLVRSRFLPHRVILLVSDEAARERLAAYMPFVHGARERQGKATAYVCQNYACEMPTSELGTLAQLLDSPEIRR
ncbi:MAG: hypothetical protein WCU88_11705 [Elusimicrobiota bacterium]|jgi:uncharacterized protein YyaL (SSP411 family)